MGIYPVPCKSLDQGDGIMKRGLILLLLFILMGPASAFTITPDGPTHVVIAPGTTYNFSYTADDQISGSLFYFDGVEAIIYPSYKEYTFADPGQYHNVSVISYDYDHYAPSNMITYNVLVQREIASTPIDTFNESNYNSVMEHVEDEDYEGLMEDSTKPYTYIFGRLFYLILFVLPYGLMWMKQQSLTIPVVLSLFLGSLFIGFVPEQYKNVILIAIALSYGYNLYMITRER